MKAKVYVTLKSGVLDPQGKAVHGALGRAGHDEVLSVRVGKVIDVELTDMSKEEAEIKLAEVCDEILANPVMENYRIEIES